MLHFFSQALYASAESAANTAATNAQPSLIESLIPFFLIFVAMYFVLIRPQAKKAKEHQNLLSSLKPGDEIVTSGGIIGRIKSISEDFVSVDLGSTHIKVMKEHISKFTKKDSSQTK